MTVLQPSSPATTRGRRPPLDGRRVLLRFAGVIARVPRYLRLGWLLMREPTLPGRGKAALAGALGYAVSPIDPLPGIIPIVGQLDDLAILVLGVRAALAAAPPEVADQHLATSGLSHEEIERDVVTIRATTVWLAGRAGAGASWLARWAWSRVTSRGRR